ncbi:hypothetical protein [uncultured Roseobacter sp.]|uniref:hypothetical protein n=1 Tax=uncultured Roseobacter sp. TaxID=114847 RepID=UPI0026110481|nr:hypothetical protein [uncultured Roseobacter sp.]
MRQIPAVCQSCGFVHPSGYGYNRGGNFWCNRTNCPCCGGPSNALDGYGALIDGLVVFVVSPDYTRQQKVEFFQLAQDVANKKLSVEATEKKLGGHRSDRTRLLREWMVAGGTVLAALATTGLLLLAAADRGANTPLEEIAMDELESEIARRQAVKYPTVLRPQTRPAVSPQTNNSHSAGTKKNTPNENRKMRRARAKKERSKPSHN